MPRVAHQKQGSKIKIYTNNNLVKYRESKKINLSRSKKLGISSKAQIEETLAKPIQRLDEVIKQKVKIVQSTSELPTDVPNDVRGMYYEGIAYIVADNVKTSEAATVLTHEIVGHLGA